MRLGGNKRSPLLEPYLPYWDGINGMGQLIEISYHTSGGMGFKALILSHPISFRPPPELSHVF